MYYRHCRHNVQAPLLLARVDPAAGRDILFKRYQDHRQLALERDYVARTVREATR